MSLLKVFIKKIVRQVQRVTISCFWTVSDIANLWRVSRTVHYRCTWGEVTRTYWVRCFLMPETFFWKAWLSSTGKKLATSLSSFQLSRAPSCQCARLFHELASTHKRHLNLHTTISRPAKCRARSIAIFDRAYMSPCVSYVHTYTCTYMQRHLRPTNFEFKNRVMRITVSE